MLNIKRNGIPSPRFRLNSTPKRNNKNGRKGKVEFGGNGLSQTSARNSHRPSPTSTKGTEMLSLDDESRSDNPTLRDSVDANTHFQDSENQLSAAVGGFETAQRNMHPSVIQVQPRSPTNSLTTTKTMQGDASRSDSTTFRHSDNVSTSNFHHGDVQPSATSPFDLQSLYRDMIAMRQEFIGVKQRLSDVEMKTGQLEEEKIELKQRLSDVEMNVARLEEDTIQMKVDHEQQLAALKQEVAALTLQNAALTQDNTMLHQQVFTLKQQVLALRQELDETQQQNSSLRREIDSLLQLLQSWIPITVQGEYLKTWDEKSSWHGLCHSTKN